MWKSTPRGLIHTRDESRVNYRTSLSVDFLHECEKIAEEHDAYINYVIENGLLNMKKKENLSFKKEKKARKQFQTTYNKTLLSWIRKTAAEHGVNMNTIIEESVRHTRTEDIKQKSYAYRIEHKERNP